MTTGITSILKNILKFITFIGAVVAAVFLLRAFVIEPFVVPTGSMESTIEVGDCILAQKITLETGSDLKPGDIVVFKNPRPRNGVDILVKRVIATSGQTVDLKDGKVFDSIAAASMSAYGYAGSGIKRAITTGRKAKGHHWYWADEISEDSQR